MTYLATEMLLYLLSAAMIGLVLGWLIWGAGRARKLKTIRSDLMATIEAEREAHQETRLALDGAEVSKNEAVEAAKAEAERSIAELRQTVDAERLMVKEAQIELERVRTDMDEAIQEGRNAGQEVVDQAMQAANDERAAAAEAMAREAQSRAQIEELRLLIGAEKLAAETARTELEKTRAEMKAQLDAERADHGQAKIALDDIRSTLMRTLGPAALGLPGVDEAGSEASADGRRNEADDRVSGPSGSTLGRGGNAPFGMMTDMAAAGDALNNPDLDEADIEDREDLNLDLSSTIDTDPESAAVEADRAIEASEVVDPAPVQGRIELRSLPKATVGSEKPANFFERRPDQVDDLQVIDGISPELERRLNEKGCYRYHQLADLSPQDIDWLTGAIDVPGYQIAVDRWVEQAKALRLQTVDDPSFRDKADQENAAS